MTNTKTTVYLNLIKEVQMNKDELAQMLIDMFKDGTIKIEHDLISKDNYHGFDHYLGTTVKINGVEVHKEETPLNY